MKICPFCAEEIQDAAIKCKHCGEFLENPSVVAEPKPSVAAPKPPKAAKAVRADPEPGDEQPQKAAAKQELPKDVSELFCGFCHSRNVPFKPVANGTVTCPRCDREIVYNIRKTRTKKSKQQSQNRVVVSRELSFRIYGPTGDEELIEVQTNGPDLEAKAGDWLGFIIIDRVLTAVVNMTVGGRLVLALPIQAEIKALEKEIAAVRPTPPASPEAQGCCAGCFMWLLGAFCFANGGDSAIMVGVGTVAAGALMPVIAKATIKEKPPDAAYQSQMEQVRELEQKLNRLKLFTQQGG